MSTLKQRLHRKNSSGTYDTIHLETSADIVLMTDGSTKLSDKISEMDTSIDGKLSTSGTAASATKLATARTIRTNLASTSTASFNGTANITPGVTGILPVANGGTGVSSIEELGALLVDTNVVAGGSASGGVEVAIGVGTTVSWAGYTWIVVHVGSGNTYLALTEIYSTTVFGSSNTYSGSTLATVAMNFQNSLSSTALAKAVDTTVNGVTAKIFVPSYDQMNGGFDYFADNASRICKYNGTATAYWTSSPYSSSGVYCVAASGGLPDNYPSDTYGFRPCVALKL